MAGAVHDQRHWLSRLAEWLTAALSSGRVQAWQGAAMLPINDAERETIAY